MQPVIYLIGPTASGKTALAFALADRYPVHLISVDSAQIYRGMNIGSAKPDAATLARYPHALINILEPEEPYSAGRFAADARREIAAAHALGKIPLLVGGTMLYYHTLYTGLDDLPPADPENRASIEARLATVGSAALHAELARVDPQSAATIQPNDRQRLVRALELLATTGQPPSALYAAQQTRRPPWPTLAIGLNPARAVLHQRIGERFHAMIAEGLIDEVAALKTRPQLSLAAPSMRSVGYRQIWQYLDGACDRETAIEQAIIASRQLAKRQITWMNNRLGRELAIYQYDPLANPAAPLLAVEKYLQQPPVKPI